jgi:hypothetical protein
MHAPNLFEFANLLFKYSLNENYNDKVLKEIMKKNKGWTSFDLRFILGIKSREVYNSSALL